MRRGRRSKCRSGEGREGSFGVFKIAEGNSGERGGDATQAPRAQRGRRSRGGRGGRWAHRVASPAGAAEDYANHQQGGRKEGGKSCVQTEATATKGRRRQQQEGIVNPAVQREERLKRPEDKQKKSTQEHTHRHNTHSRGNKHSDRVRRSARKEELRLLYMHMGQRGFEGGRGQNWSQGGERPGAPPPPLLAAACCC